MDNPKMVYVETTEEHFLEGEPCSRFKCAFALALNGKLKDGYVASVGPNTISYYEESGFEIGKNAKFAVTGGLVASTATPRSVKRFIRKYDCEKPEDTFVLPFRTRVRFPREILA